jgi:glycosyltransferase involved in cell wall biosynthesis
MKLFNHNTNIYVSHFVGLTGIGGVQSNFVEYLNHAIKSDYRLKHKIYTLGQVDSQYKLPIDVLDIRQPRNLIALILDVISKETIVHFYNNLTSIKLALFFLVLPVKNLILHERGTVWNVSLNYRKLIQFVTWKASVVLSNSHATKTMLVHRFLVPDEKVQVLHNGIDVLSVCKHKKRNKEVSNKFRVGYIGRFEAPKGVHVLIDAMNYLTDENFELILAGEGTLEDDLKSSANRMENIFFIGRVENPYKFISGLDLLVVPSIREPLGNVCLEAGLCKVPVIASNVDGIPEIIENQVSGILLNPVHLVNLIIPSGSVPVPEFVINPNTHRLCRPMQLDPSQLAGKITEISKDDVLREKYTERLYTKVVKNFSIERYTMKLHNIYINLFELENKSIRS